MSAVICKFINSFYCCLKNCNSVIVRLALHSVRDCRWDGVGVFSVFYSILVSFQVTCAFMCSHHFHGLWAFELWDFGPTQPSIPPGSVNEYQLRLGKQKAGMVHSVSGWTRGVQVKLWDPLRTRAIPECLRGVFTTRRYTNARLPLPYLPLNK